MKIPFIATTLFSILLSSPLAEAGVKELSWMEGKWLSIDAAMPMESQYSYQPEIDSIVGLTRVVQEGKTSFLESEFVTEKNGKVVLTVMQLDHPPVSFTMTKQTQTSIEYTNPENPFPRVIQYFLDSEGQLVGKIVGEIEGQQTSQQFILKKVQ